jgi:hypothetical protein
VRSTTHRRGTTTKPLMSFDRLTISMRKTGIFGHGSFNLPDVVAAIGPDQFEP